MRLFLEGKKTKGQKFVNQTIDLVWLSHQDSNLDRQYQKLQCYHYTMRHSIMFCFKSDCKGTSLMVICKIFRGKYFQ